MKAVLLTAVLVMATAAVSLASPIIIRHDRNDDDYLELGRRYAAVLCHVRNARGIVNGGGTLIAPRWVLSAAHVARSLKAGRALEIDGASYAIDKVFVHPEWGGPSPRHDIALIRLGKDVTGVQPVPFYKNDDEAGREIIVVGAGMVGTGLTGPLEDDGQVRGATNRIEEVGEAWLRFVFDGPDSEQATALEGISGPGDSGGPAFIIVDGIAYLAGISSGQDDTATNGKPGRYGVSEYYTRVSQYRSWIEQTMQAEEAGTDDLVEKLEAYMNRLTAQGFSGGLLVARDGALVLSKGYGMADRARSLPFSNTTVFPTGSITKQFTGAAILKLEMMGKLSVEDRLTTYFDAVPADKAGITLHHLLTHSAGFPGALGFDFAAISREDYVAEAMASDLMFQPGAGYEYSNVGYSLLAAIIEQVAGTSYDAFVQQHLFEPAGMTQTGYVFSRWQPEDHAHGYRDGEDWGTFADKTWADDGPYWHLRGNGGILSTLDDLYLWHRALDGEAVLSKEARQKYYAPHVREGEGSPSFYGYGWTTQETPRGQLIAHNGGNPYFSNDFLRYVDAGVVIYLTSNTASHRAPRLSQTIADIVFGDPYQLPPETIEVLTRENLGETPLGRRVLAYLALLESGDPAEIEPFAREHLVPDILEKYAMDDLVEEFGGDQLEIGAVDVAKIVQKSAHELELTVQSKATGQWWLLRLSGDSEAPHHLAGIGVMDTMPPAGAGPTGVVTVEEGTATAAPGSSKWQLPDSATGRALTALLTAIDNGDDTHTRTFVETHFDEAFLNNFPMEEHVSVFRDLHLSLPDVDVSQVEKVGPYSVQFVLVSGQTATKIKGSFDLESQPPHRFVDLGFVPVEE